MASQIKRARSALTGLTHPIAERRRNDCRTARSSRTHLPWPHSSFDSSVLAVRSREAGGRGRTLPHRCELRRKVLLLSFAAMRAVAHIDSESRIEVLVGNHPASTAGRNVVVRDGIEPSSAIYPVLEDGRGKRWMQQRGRVLRFWMAVFGLVAGLQSACIPAQSNDLWSTGTRAKEDQFRLALLIKDTAGSLRDGSVVRVSEVSAEKSEVSADKSEVSPERERDHGARSPQEMLAWFLKGAAALTAMVLFYKGLKWWVLRRRQSE